MSFARDKLYNGYVRRNMSTIVKSVDVGEMIPELPCLTAHDRETIEARAQNRGNREGMVLLLDCLKRRENWPEQFIEALEACEQPTIAAEVRAEYNALRGINNLNPSSSPVTVIGVQPTPPSHESIPVTVANSQAAEPATQRPPDQAPRVVPPTEPLPEPPQPTPIELPPRPSTPPPSPETQHAEATVAPLPYRENNTYLEPEENSESDIQVDTGVTPENMSTENNPVSSLTTDQPHLTPEHSETDTQSLSDSHQPVTPTEDRPPQGPSLMNSDVTDGSSFLTLTPAKPPVQDTTPPVYKIPTAVLEPEETSEPPATQTVERRPQTETRATIFPEPGAAGMNTSLDDDDDDDDDVCLSKPEPLVSVQPQNHASRTISAPSLPEQPYSGCSERLELSESASACSAVKTVSALPCQEIGVAPEYNEPEENHYESPCESLDTQEVLENVVQVSEEPSFLNKDGQSFAPQSTSSTKGAVPSFLCSELHHPYEPKVSPDVKKHRSSENKADPHTSSALSANGKYILAALGVGACAMVIAWRLRK